MFADRDLYQSWDAENLSILLAFYSMLTDLSKTTWSEFDFKTACFFDKGRKSKLFYFCEKIIIHQNNYRKVTIYYSFVTIIDIGGILC